VIIYLGSLRQARINEELLVVIELWNAAEVIFFSRILHWVNPA